MVPIAPGTPGLVPSGWWRTAGPDPRCGRRGGDPAHGSPRQLDQDAFVAERDGLALRLVQGDMADLSAFGDASFHLVVNPISTLVVPDVGKVWHGVAFKDHRLTPQPPNASIRRPRFWRS